MDTELRQAIDALGVEHKSVVTALQTKYDSSVQQITALQKQLDSVDLRTQQRHAGGGVESKSLAQEIFENPEFKRMGELGGRGRVTIRIDDFEKKTLTNASVGASTSGVLAIDREPGIVPVQYRQLRIRDLLRSKPTKASVCDYVRVSAFTNNASPQVEASDKAQSDLVLTSVQAKVVTVAHWVPVSKQ
jgi:HK97 family phage major capsid protein